MVLWGKGGVCEREWRGVVEGEGRDIELRVQRGHEGGEELTGI